jgi:hypothetical protein
MINWREKFRAFAIHFVVTAALAAAAAALIFAVWFPAPFAELVGGTELFVLVVGCDLALGPLISLVIYNSRKTRCALIIDYTLFGAVQLAALVYGVYIVAGTRPVYMAFSGDRFEVVVARDINPRELQAARSPEYRSLPVGHPRFVAVQVPAADHNDALFEALAGNEEHMRPKFYVPFDSQLAAIRSHAGTVVDLEKKFPAYAAPLELAVKSVSTPPDRLRWLPLRYHTKFWTVLIDTADGKPVAYAPVDPYGED